MQIGDLVKYRQSDSLLIVMGFRDKYGGKRAMIRCFCAHLQEFYWFWEDQLEAVCK